jgi:hypothetical protein
VTEINVSAKLPYHTQVNNKLFPLSACNTTSAIMWMLDCGIKFEFPASMQPEDYLTQITETPEAYAYMKKVAPWAWDREHPKVPPRQVHACLSWAINKLADKEVTRFRTDVTMQELVAELALGRAAILSGIFTRSGHVVTLVGLTTKQELRDLKDPRSVKLDSILSWIIDDPYGNYHTSYQDHRGNDMRFLPEEFDRLTKVVCSNTKWAHLKVG